MQALSTVTSLPDDALLARVGILVYRERHATADLIAALGEVDARKLYLGAGCSSLFSYCTHVLHLSENAAYDRIAAARCARRYPYLLERLAEGAVTLTAVCLLVPVMTAENANDLLNRARNKSKRAVERLVAQIRPQPAISTSVRKLPIPRSPTPGDSAVVTEDKACPNAGTFSDNMPSGRSATNEPEPGSIRLETEAQNAGRRAAIKPLAPEMYKVQFTLSGAGYKKLRRAQDLLRHAIPNGDAGAIIERALGLLVEQLEKTKLAETKRPQLKSRIAEERIATHSGGGQTRSLAARQRPMRVCRDARALP